MQVAWLRLSSLRIKSSWHASRMWQRTSIWLPKIPKRSDQSLMLLHNSENPQGLRGNLRNLHERLKTKLKRISYPQSVLSIKFSPKTFRSSHTRHATAKIRSKKSRIAPLANRSSVWTLRKRRKTFKINEWSTDRITIEQLPHSSSNQTTTWLKYRKHRRSESKQWRRPIETRILWPALPVLWWVEIARCGRARPENMLLRQLLAKK